MADDGSARCSTTAAAAAAAAARPAWLTSSTSVALAPPRFYAQTTSGTAFAAASLAPTSTTAAAARVPPGYTGCVRRDGSGSGAAVSTSSSSAASATAALGCRSLSHLPGYTGHIPRTTTAAAAGGSAAARTKSFAGAYATTKSLADAEVVRALQASTTTSTTATSLPPWLAIDSRRGLMSFFSLDTDGVAASDNGLADAQSFFTKGRQPHRLWGGGGVLASATRVCGSRFTRAQTLVAQTPTATR